MWIHVRPVKLLLSDPSGLQLTTEVDGIVDSSRTSFSRVRIVYTYDICCALDRILYRRCYIVVSEPVLTGSG